MTVAAFLTPFWCCFSCFGCWLFVFFQTVHPHPYIPPNSICCLLSASPSQQGRSGPSSLHPLASEPSPSNGSSAICLWACQRCCSSIGGELNTGDKEYKWEQGEITETLPTPECFPAVRPGKPCVSHGKRPKEILSFCGLIPADALPDWGGGFNCSVHVVLHLKKNKNKNCQFTPSPYYQQPALHTSITGHCSPSPQNPQRWGLLQLFGDCFLLPAVTASTASLMAVVCRYCQAQLDSYCQNCQSVVTINVLAG